MGSLEGPEDWHVMISYHKTQQAWATEINQYLQDNELSVCTLQLSNDDRETEDYVWRNRIVVVLMCDLYAQQMQSNRTLNIINQKTEMLGQPSRLLIVNDQDGPLIPNIFPMGQVLEKTSPKLLPKLLRMVACREFESSRAPVFYSSTGYTLAWSYYFGYLHLVLPRWGELGLNIQDRIRKCKFWCENNSERVMPLKMIVVMMESCKCPPKFSDIDPEIQSTNQLLNCAAHRSGHPEREYRAPIYQFDDAASGVSYYAAADLCPSVLTLYEMAESPHCALTSQQMTTEVRRFYYALKHILAHSGKDLENKYSILYIKDQTRPRTNFSHLMIRRIKQEILDDVRRETETGGMREQAREPSHHIQTSLGNIAPAVHAQSMARYDMSHRPRGVALIVNIARFRGKPERVGSHNDVGKLVNLMERLDFEVHVKENCSRDEMLDIFTDHTMLDHGSFNCFLCFLMTHGRLGEVYGSDGASMRIMDIVKLFNTESCPSLTGKPKVFFVQACQLCEDDMDDEGAAGGGFQANYPSNVLTEDTESEFSLSATPSWMSTGESSSSYSMSSQSTESMPFTESRYPWNVPFDHNQRTLLPSTVPVSNLSAPLTSSTASTPAASTATVGISDQSEHNNQGNVGFSEATLSSTMSILSLVPDGSMQMDASVGGEQNRALFVPDEEDFLMGYATLPSRQAARHTSQGSVYISHLVEEMGKVDSGMNLTSILEKVRDNVREEMMRQQDSERMRSQMPFYLTTLTKRLYFDFQ